MKCHELLPLIETFLDGECSQALSTSIGAHLSNCAACTDAVRLLETEQNFYVGHRERIDVLPSLWGEVLDRVGANQPDKTSATSTIAARFAAFRTRIGERRLAPLPAAALLILAIGLTVAITKYIPGKIGGEHPAAQTERETAQTSKQTESRPVEPGLPSTQEPGAANTERRLTRDNVAQARKQLRKRDPALLVREAEEKYLAAIAILQRDASHRRVRLDPEIRVQLEQTLAGVDRAIANTRRAVHSTPRDPVAVQYMLAAYSRKVDILRQMVAD